MDQFEKDVRSANLELNLAERFFFSPENYKIKDRLIEIAQGLDRQNHVTFITGATGTGKSALARSFQSELQHSGKSCALVRTEKVVLQMLDVYRTRPQKEFALSGNALPWVQIIDEVDYLIGKTATQENFISWVGRLNSSGVKVIILGAPDLKENYPGFSSLREKILQYELVPLDSISRNSFVREQIKRMGIGLSEEIIVKIQCQSNIGMIVGGLDRLAKYAKKESITCFDDSQSLELLGKGFENG